MTVSSFDPGAIRLPDPPAHVHMIGIGGVGVSGLARMLAGRGYRVSGSDMSQSPVTDALRAEGIQVAIGHDAANVAGADLVVMTAAVRAENPEVVAAQAAGMPVVKRAALLGLLANAAECIAVAGSHGKSTTSGMATLALERAGKSPSFAVGATVRELGTNARLGDGPHFVVEADEYDYSFLWLRPSVAIITNIEHDHPDIFPDLDAVLDAFRRFASGICDGGTLVIAADDPGCQALLVRLGGPQRYRIVTFGEQSGDWQVAREDDGPALVTAPSGRMFALRLAVPGRHNLMNALAVLAASEGLGVEPAALVPGLEAFGGVSRRFELVLDSPELTVVNDYAHHSTEVAATIGAARERYPNRRIVAVFQPHTYSRTKALLDEFAAALDAADIVVLAEIYPSRETDSLGVSSSSIAERMAVVPVVATSPDEAATIVRQLTQPGDVILVMGAGDIYRAAEALGTATTD
jgi:UDP-N-acetylmuramate--alanine ligase